MKKIDPCALYLRQVGRRLRCPKAERRELLAGLASAITDVFPDLPVPTLASLTAHFGSPQSMAQELEGALPSEKVEGYLVRRKFWTRLGLAVGALILLLLVGYIIWLLCHDASYIVVGPATKDELGIR